MQTITNSRRSVKSDHPIRERRRPYTQADLDWAAQAFGELEDNRRLEEQAEQAAWDDRFNRGFPAGCCQLCGEPADELDPVHELCSGCLTAAENAGVAGENGRAGLGYRVF
jgi:hypothetical protein